MEQIREQMVFAGKNLFFKLDSMKAFAPIKTIISAAVFILTFLYAMIREPSKSLIKK